MSRYPTLIGLLLDITETLFLFGLSYLHVYTVNLKIKGELACVYINRNLWIKHEHVYGKERLLAGIYAVSDKSFLLYKCEKTSARSDRLPLRLEPTNGAVHLSGEHSRA